MLNFFLQPLLKSLFAGLDSSWNVRKGPKKKHLYNKFLQ